MTLERLWMIVRLNFQRGAGTRGKWLREKHVFAECGDPVRYQIRTIPLCPKLIKIGNNVTVGSGVSFIVHDATHGIYNLLPGVNEKLGEYVNPIEIGDNVFIGAYAKIMGGVKVGSNVIIAAGAVVTNDLPDGGIYGGVPAKRIGSVEDFWKRRKENYYPTIKTNKHLSEQEIEDAWKYFYDSRR